MPDSLVDPPGLSTGGGGAPAPKKLPLPLIVGGAVAVVAVVLVLMKKKSSATAAASASGAGPTTTSVIYPQDTSGTDANTLASYYNQLQTGIANSTGTTADNITQAQEALATDIAGVAATTTPTTPVSAAHTVIPGPGGQPLVQTGVEDATGYTGYTVNGGAPLYALTPGGNNWQQVAGPTGSQVGTVFATPVAYQADFDTNPVSGANNLPAFAGGITLPK
jgi:hypothetical protein